MTHTHTYIHNVCMHTPMSVYQTQISAAILEVLNRPPLFLGCFRLRKCAYEGWAEGRAGVGGLPLVFCCSMGRTYPFIFDRLPTDGVVDRERVLHIPVRAAEVVVFLLAEVLTASPKLYGVCVT